jgi:hypothetical protein
MPSITLEEPQVMRIINKSVICRRKNNQCVPLQTSTIFKYGSPSPSLLFSLSFFLSFSSLLFSSLVFSARYCSALHFLSLSLCVVIMWMRWELVSDAHQVPISDVLLVACDGIFEELSNEQVAAFVMAVSFLFSLFLSLSLSLFLFLSLSLSLSRFCCSYSFAHLALARELLHHRNQK